MKQILKRILRRFPLGQKAWNYLAGQYRKIRKARKRATQKKNDFKRYVYPVIGRHPSKKAVFLVLSPTYTNLGDHAIAKAEIDLLAQWGIPFREVTIDVVKILARHGDYSVFGRGTVLVTGGGFLGSLWPHMHEMTCQMAEQNPKAKIVILPNTLYFEPTPEGTELLESSMMTFNLPNVKRVYLREKTSYAMVQGKCSAAKLMPDAVMSMNESQAGVLRSGCLICLRNDKEKTLSDCETEIVRESVRQLFGEQVRTIDMRNPTDVLLDVRMAKLEQKFDEFRSAELVITDRLHGMIFAAITGTPCIVMNSRSHKLAGCYEWLKHLDYIRFCGSTEEICKTYTNIPQGEHRYDARPLLPWFEEMKKELIEIVKE